MIDSELSPQDEKLIAEVCGQVLLWQPELEKLFIKAHQKHKKPLLVDLALFQGISLLANEVLMNMVRHLRLSDIEEPEIKALLKRAYKEMLELFEDGHKSGLEKARHEIVKRNMKKK